MRGRIRSGLLLAGVALLAACGGPVGAGPPVADPSVAAAPPTSATTAPGPTTAAATPTGPTSSTMDKKATTAAPSAAPVPLAVENFDGPGLDPTRWNVYDAAATNGVSRWTPANVSVAGGELRITGQGRDPTGRTNASGGVCWCRGDGARTYGRWQIRARFEAGTGYGQAILLWPVSERWPDDGEIDIVETPTGAKRTADATVHWGTSAAHRQDSARASGDFTDWHVYTVDWRPAAVRVWIDDRLLYDSSRDRGVVVPDTPMSLALQQEPGPFGTNWVPPPDPSTPDQVVMHIDWIRVYA